MLIHRSLSHRLRSHIVESFHRSTLNSLQNSQCNPFKSEYSKTHYARFNTHNKNNNSNNIVPPKSTNKSSSSSSRHSSAAFTHEIPINNEGLLEFPIFEYRDPKELTNKSPFTPLASELHGQIKIRGPLTIADYMYHCLQNPSYGYYTANKSEIISDKGDFITSPEISQLFGEITAIWIIQMIQQFESSVNNNKSFNRIKLVELGPGRGTLMKDCLRTLKQFPAIYKAIELHLVETSINMREEQAKQLKVTLPENTDKNQSIRTNEVPSATPIDNNANILVNENASESQSLAEARALLGIPEIEQNINNMKSKLESLNPDCLMSGLTSDGIRVIWHSSLRQANLNKANINNEITPVIILAHEFFDALPIFQFQLTPDKGWCERLVDIDSNPQTEHHFRYVLSQGPSPAARAFIPPNLLNGEGINNNSNNDPNNVNFLEISPVSLSVMESITQILSKHSGAALIIDYGTGRRSVNNTLQAVKNHSFVSPLSEPGNVDLTALVDFPALSDAVKRTIKIMREKSNNTAKSYNINIWPLITQSQFLRENGIAKRVEQLYNAIPSENVEEAKNFLSAARRLVAAEEMGNLFKCMAITAGWNNKLTPPAFYELQQNKPEETQQQQQQQKDEESSVNNNSNK